jgi:MscS family membrane protein
VKGLNHEEGESYIQFNLSFYVDDIRLEDGKRGDRVSSQIYQEILQHLKEPPNN